MTKNQIDYWNLQETKRANTETARHNQAYETETNRHNVATEGIDMGKLSETSRHNQATEGIDMGKLNESIRHNQVNEGIDLGKLNESIRHNQATESQAMRDLTARYAELQEMTRHNIAYENVKDRKNEIQSSLGVLAQQLNEAKYNTDKKIREKQQVLDEIQLQGNLLNKQQDLNNKSIDTISKLFSRGLGLLRGATNTTPNT